MAAIGELKARFQVKRVVIVADRGTVGRRTLEALEQAGFDSIVGVRLRKRKAARAVLARAGRYHEVASSLRVKQVVHEGVRSVVCHDPEAAAEEGAGRDRRPPRAGAFQGAGAPGRKPRLPPHLRVAPGALALDTKKIAEDARYGGKGVLRTSTELSADEVALAYESLWQAERLFFASRY